MKKIKYQARIELQGVQFGKPQSTDLNQLRQEVIESVKEYQKSHCRGRDGQINLYADNGKRYMMGKRTRIEWELIETIDIPYEARPRYEVGDKFTFEIDGKQTGEIVERRLEEKYHDFYYTLEIINNETDEIKTEEYSEYGIYDQWKKER